MNALNLGILVQGFCLRMRHIHKIVIAIAFFIFVPLGVSAVGTKPLGEHCESTQECGLNMGCRQSDKGEYKICKIAVPNGVGCAIEKDEPLCGEGMVCKENRCVLTFGIDDTQGGKKEEAKTQELSPEGFSFSTLLSPFRTLFSTSVVEKGARVLLAAGLLLGLAFVLRGILLYQNALGLIPQQRRGLNSIGIGVAFFAGAIFLWYLFR